MDFKFCKNLLQGSKRNSNLDFLVVFAIMGNAPVFKEDIKMTRINNTTSSNFLDNMSLYTKRTCSDNSELFITSKLNKLYEQAVTSKNLFNSKRNLRKIIEGNHIQENL